MECIYRPCGANDVYLLFLRGQTLKCIYRSCGDNVVYLPSLRGQWSVFTVHVGPDT